MVTVGETVIEAPLPSSVPPHDPLYQTQSAPVPSIPPDMKSVVGLPEHTDKGVAVADVAAVELVFTVTVTLAHVVLLHAPSALT